MLLSGLGENSCQLGVMFCTAWRSFHEGLLYITVDILIGGHIGQPAVSQDGREQLAYARCKGNRPKVDG